MGYVKEPEGVDFIINGEPLTDKQKQEISAYIKADIERREKQKKRRKKNTERRKNAAESRR